MATRKNQNASAQEKDSGTKPEDTQAQQQPEEQKPASDENQGDTGAPSPEEQKPSENQQQSEEQKPTAQSNERKVVTFLRPFSRYTRGDTAGFEPEEADRLVKKRVAVEGTKLPAPTDNQDKEPKA